MTQKRYDDNAAPTKGRVFRRRVFYIPGYDPFHPRRYRELYRKEGNAQAQISGYSLDLHPKHLNNSYGWQVSTMMESPAEAEFEVLVWSDIVRDSMKTGIFSTYLQLLFTSWLYIRSGALFRLMKLRKGPIIAALYPIAFLIGQLIIAGLAAWGIQRLTQAILPDAIGPFVGAGIGVAAFVAMLRWFRAKDNKVFAYYLMHDYAFSAQSGGANPPELETRMVAFCEKIREALQSDYDEVLVIGHSSGAHLAVSILADLIRKGLPASAPTLSFLSLGQVIPMLSFLPGADRLRADLHYLSTRPELTWIDVTAPGDGCAFALCDPVSVSGVAPQQKKWPLVISAAFTQTLSPERWKELRWKFFRLHFQYLCAFDRPGDYDYFRITGGPMTLAKRFAGRNPSSSRIEDAVSGHTNMAA